ncbi:MAG: DoxX family protein [Phycisphaerales bacterium]
MSSRDSMAVSFAPIFLRVALSVTFIWAGLAKMMADIPVSGESAAVLANMGVDGLQRSAQSSPAPAAPAPSSPKPPKKDGAWADPAQPLIRHAAMQNSAGTFTAADFPNPVRVASLYGIALALHDAAQLNDREGKAHRFPLVPPMIATGKWPVWLAWAASLTELLAGLLVLFGLFTRLAAFSLACVMMVAMWLTQIGPAMQSGNATLGFLPAHAAFDMMAWQTLLWQLALACAAWNLVFAGPGGLSMDRAIAGRPVVNKPKPAAPAK